MNLLHLISLTFLAASTPTNVDSHTKHFYSLDAYPKAKKVMARLTTYSKNEKGGDRDTRRGISSTGKPLLNEYSAAIDPKLIPYNSKIIIPSLNMKLIAQDTGKDVRSRKASKKTGRNEPIVDIFFDREKDARIFANNNPKVVEIFIIK